MDQATFIIEIRNGSFSYGETVIFKNLNFSLERHNFYGLIGPNGSGKSTLIDILMATSKLQSGTISYLAKPLEKYTRNELAKNLALVPQSITVGFDFNVHDIVMMGRHPHIPRFSPPADRDWEIVSQSLSLLDIAHLQNRPVSQLSGGEKQRVIVARALAQDTGVLMLDEATSNLDIEHSLQIMRLLRKRVDSGKVTVIAAIHDLNMAAAFCDNLIVLKDGEVHDIGPVKKILTKELLHEVFSVQAEISHNPSHHYPSIEYDMRG